MPFVVPFIASALTAVGATAAAAALATTVAGVTTLTGLGTILGYGLGLAATAAIGFVQSTLQRNAARKNARGVIDPADGKQTSKGSVTSRRVVYGRFQISGAVIFEEERSAFFYRQIAFCEGPIVRFDQIFINDAEISIDALGDVASPPFVSGATRFVRIEQRIGQRTTTTTSALLSAVFTQFTADHLAKGIAKIAVRFRNVTTAQYQNIYKNRVPEIKATVIGTQVYDPRDPDHLPPGVVLP